MAFEYEVATLDGMDEAMAGNYLKVGDVYRLDVNGVEDVTGLKNTAEARKVERDALKLKLKEIEDAKNLVDAEKAEAERLRLVEKGEFKTLAEKSQAKELETATELADLKAKIAKNAMTQLALESVAGMTADPVKAEMLKEQALKHIQSSDAGASISGPDGITDVAGLKLHLETTMPFLVDGSKANGGGANGSTFHGTPGGYINDYTETELKSLRGTNRGAYDEVLKKGYK